MGVTGVLVPFDLDFGVEFSAEDFDFFTCTLDFLSNHLPFFNFFPYSKWLFSSEESSKLPSEFESNPSLESAFSGPSRSSSSSIKLREMLKIHSGAVTIMSIGGSNQSKFGVTCSVLSSSFLQAACGIPCQKYFRTSCSESSSSDATMLQFE